MIDQPRGSFPELLLASQEIKALRGGRRLQKIADFRSIEKVSQEIADQALPTWVLFPLSSALDGAKEECWRNKSQCIAKGASDEGSVLKASRKIFDSWGC